MLIALIVIVAVAAVADGLDILFSVRSFAKGAIEGDETKRDLFGQKPRAWQLAVYDFAWATPGIFAGVAGLLWYAPAFGGVTWLAVFAVKHFIGANKGRKWLKANG